LLVRDTGEVSSEAATIALPVDKKRPIGSLVRLFRPYRWSMLLASVVFIIKDSPIWILPVLTGNIIDVVVSHKPLTQLWLYAAIAVGLLVLMKIR
jgi:ATP-binding cassette subfamily B protein